MSTNGIKRYTIRRLRWQEICQHQPEHHTWIARGLANGSELEGYRIWKRMRGQWALRHADNEPEYYASRAEAQAAAQAHFEATLKHYLRAAP